MPKAPAGRLADLSPLSLARRGDLRARVRVMVLVIFATVAPSLAVSVYYNHEVGLALVALEAQTELAFAQVQTLSRAAAAGEAVAAEVSAVTRELEGMRSRQAQSAELIDRSQRDVVTILLLTLVAAAVVFTWLPGGVTAPLRLILNAVRRAEEGDYRQRLQVGGRDEVGKIASHLSSLFARLEEEGRGTRGLLAGARGDLELFGASLDGPACIVDRERVLVYANQPFREVFGVQEQPVGERLARWIDDEDLASLIRRGFAGGREEATLRLKGGDEATHRWRVRTGAGRSPEGEIDRVALIFARATLIG